jgi:transcriptional regulator with XRE-family HTH domain
MSTDSNDLPVVPESAFADRLNHLVATVHPASRGPYTDAEIGVAVGVTAQAVRYWRQGKRSNPTLVSLQKLAQVFGVPVAYFFDDQTANQLDGELRVLTAMRDQGVRQIALRSAGLSPEGRAAIVEMIKRIGQIEASHGGASPSGDVGSQQGQ